MPCNSSPLGQVFNVSIESICLAGGLMLCNDLLGLGGREAADVDIPGRWVDALQRIEIFQRGPDRLVDIPGRGVNALRLAVLGAILLASVRRYSRQSG
jgi:hypothetical protein